MLKPIGARVLIQPFQAATQTESGLIMENSSNASTPVKGTVIEAGDKSQFKTGDILFFRRFAMDTLKIVTPQGEKEVNLCDDEDVLAIEFN